MFEFLRELVFWHWLGFAGLLLILEMLTGSGFLLWMGISASVIGVVLFFFPAFSPIWQWLGFAVFSILTAILWKSYLKKNPIRTDRPALNRRGEQYVGRVFTLDSPVINGMGVVHVDDTTWRIRCMDLPAGSRIKIMGVDGVILLAEPHLG